MDRIKVIHIFVKNFIVYIKAFTHNEIRSELSTKDHLSTLYRKFLRATYQPIAHSMRAN